MEGVEREGQHNTAVSNRGSGAGRPSLGSALLCTSCVTLGKSPSLSVSPFLPLLNRTMMVAVSDVVMRMDQSSKTVLGPEHVTRSCLSIDGP